MKISRQAELPFAVGVCAMTVAIMVALHHDAAKRAVITWWEIPTYSHALLIIPLSIYLVVMKHDRTPTPAPRPMPWLTLLHLPILGLWYVAAATEVIEVQQFCLLGAIYVTLLSLVGFRVLWHHAVATLLLVFLVPSGQFALPALQAETAQVSVLLLRIANVPVFLDGLSIQLPESGYYVAEGCAGLNFVLVSIVLALVVGELFYRSLAKRIAVILGFLAMALIANPIRVFAIVAIDHATNRTTDIVSDHLFYGWAFFAAVLGACLPFALTFRDDLEPPPAQPVAPSAVPAGMCRRLGVTAATGVILAGLGPVALMLSGAFARSPIAIDRVGLPALGPDGAAIEMAAFWRPVTSPALRLLDRWPPRKFVEDPPVRRATLETALGPVGAYYSNLGGERRIWAVCYLVDGRCAPDGGVYRRAILRSLPKAPLVPAGLVVLSRPTSGEDPRASATYTPLGAAMEAAVALLRVEADRK